MSEIDWTRLVIVTAIHGEKSLGWVPENISGSSCPAFYIEDQVAKGRPITLHEVRNMVGQARPEYDPTTGRLIGIGRTVLLLPIDLMAGPLPSLTIMPSTWYFPGDHNHIREKIEHLLTQAVELEASIAAAEAGIIQPPLPSIRRS